MNLSEVGNIFYYDHIISVKLQLQLLDCYNPIIWNNINIIC